MHLNGLVDTESVELMLKMHEYYKKKPTVSSNLAFEINFCKLELELKLQRRAEKERKKMEELTILTPRSRHFPEIQFDVGLNSNNYQEEIQENLESRENNDSRESKNQIKKLTKDGETYVHGFDFLQKIQHWMWNLGLFNKE